MKIGIYGAGVFGKRCFQFLTSIGTTIDFFCQTNIDEKMFLYGIPILDFKELSKVREDKIIFLAIKNEAISEEIRKRIEEKIDNVINIYNYCDIIRESDLLYGGTEFEIKIMHNYWKTYLENPSYMKAKKDKLCRGLSEKDIDIINRIINRMKSFVIEQSMCCDIFSIEEKKQIRNMEKSMLETLECDVQEKRSVYSYKNYKLYEKNFEPCLFYYQMGLKQVKKLKHIYGKNIIDVGAYIGDSSIILSDFTNKNVYAFEPFCDNCKKIYKTAELNKKSNIIPVNLALGEDTSKREFYLRNDNNTGHGMIKRENLDYKEKIEVNQITLDEYVDSENIEIGLIKVDIEGAERNFLKGAKKTICEQKPILLISIYHSAEDFFEIKTMIEELKAGYSFRIFHPVTRNSFLLETALICEIQ